MKVLFSIVSVLSFLSCKTRTEPQDGGLKDVGQVKSKTALSCEVDMADGLEVKDRRDVFEFSNPESKETGIKWNTFVKFKGPTDPGYESHLQLTKHTRMSCNGCFEILAKTGTGKYRFVITGGEILDAYHMIDGKEVALGEGPVRCTSPNAGSTSTPVTPTGSGASEGQSVCVLYASNVYTEFLDKIDCNSKVTRESCVMANEEKIFGYNSKALFNKIVFIPIATTGCNDRSIARRIKK
ncbi:MAG: hypothetical protein NTV34_10090 [Proteobacteria bacterium]|nr:hypothetical protein [Pseudomonadota bacterium]